MTALVPGFVPFPYVILGTVVFGVAGVVVIGA